MQQQQYERVEDSLAPVAIERPTVDEAALAFQRGRNQILMRLGGLASVALVALWFANDAMNALNARNEARTTLASIRADAFESFFFCALPDSMPERVPSREKLIAAFERNANREGNQYGPRLASCVDDLQRVNDGLNTMAVPKGAALQHRALQASAERLLEDFRSYAASLNSPRPPDYVQALALMDRVASSYLGYERARRKFGEVLVQ